MGPPHVAELALWQRILAWTEILGGVLGCIGALTDLTGGPAGVFGRIYLVPAGLGLLSVAAGLLLVAGSRTGRRLSFVVQVMQLVVMGAPVRLVYIAGANLLLIVSQAGLLVSMGVTATVQVACPAPDGSLRGTGLNLGAFWGVLPRPLSEAEWTVGINLVPAMFIFLLLRHRPDLVGARQE